MNPIIRNLTIAAGIFALSGCATTTGGSSSMGNNTRAKFLKEAWVSPAIKGKAPSELYSSVYFEPTSTRLLKKQGWWAQQTARTASELEADAYHLASYTHDALVSASQNHSGKKLQVVSHPGPDTLIIQTAITEITPSKAYWNAAATAAGFAVPGAGMLSMAGKGSIVIEGRVRDGNTGALVAVFRHSMVDKSAMVNVAAMKWYGGSEANITEFARKTAEFLNAPSDATVNASMPFKLVAF